MFLFLKSLFSVLPFFWLLVVLALLFYWRGRKRSAQWTGIAALTWLLLASTPPLPRLLIRKLEKQYEVFQGPLQTRGNSPIHILVLGGGHTSDERLPANNQLSLSALGRLAEGIRLHRLHPGSLLVLSGYPGLDKISNAEVMYNAALLLGVKAEDMTIIPEPENTRQEALAYFSRFGNQHPLIVVSSATHIPRAMIWLQKVGLHPIAAPTNHAIKLGSEAKIRWWLPGTSNIDFTNRIIYEYAGTIQAGLSRQKPLKSPPLLQTEPVFTLSAPN